MLMQIYHVIDQLPKHKERMTKKRNYLPTNIVLHRPNTCKVPRHFPTHNLESLNPKIKSMAEQCTTLSVSKSTSRIPHTRFIDQHSVQRPPCLNHLPTNFLFQEEQGGSVDFRVFSNSNTTSSWRVDTATEGYRQLAQRPNRTKRPLNSWMGYRSKSLLHIMNWTDVKSILLGPLSISETEGRITLLNLIVG